MIHPTVVWWIRTISTNLNNFQRSDCDKFIHFINNKFENYSVDNEIEMNNIQLNLPVIRKK